MSQIETRRRLFEIGAFWREKADATQRSQVGDSACVRRAIGQEPVLAHDQDRRVHAVHA